MRAKIVTPTAERDALAISDYIHRDNPAAADRYLRCVLATFFDWPDEVTPKRAAAHLPESIREIPVPGFRGYTLRIAILGETTYLLAAFAPGLPDAYKDARTLRGYAEGAPLD